MSYDGLMVAMDYEVPEEPCFFDVSDGGKVHIRDFEAKARARKEQRFLDMGMSEEDVANFHQLDVLMHFYGLCGQRANMERGGISAFADERLCERCQKAWPSKREDGLKPELYEHPQSYDEDDD